AVQRAEPKRAVQRAALVRTVERATAQRDIARSVNEKALIRAEELERKITLGAGKPSGDLLSTFGQPSEAYGVIDHDIVLRTDQASAASLRTALRDQSDRFADRSMVFRLGHLMRLTAGNSTAERPGSTHDTDNLEGLARVIADGAGGRRDVTFVHARDISSSGMDERRYIDLQRREKAVTQRITSDGTKVWVPDEDEDPFVEALPVYLPHGWPAPDDDDNAAEWAIVHFQADDDSPAARDIPTIEEYVLIGGGIAGNIEGTHKYESYELDPNQAYTVVPPPGDRPGSRVRPERFWDADNGVVVNRWYVEPLHEGDIDEMLEGEPRPGVQKADDRQYAPQHRPWRESDVVRDALGRFADEPGEQTQQEAPVSRAAPRRAQRIVRRTRATRATLEPTRAAVQRDIRRAAPKRAGFQRALQRAAMERVVRRANTDPDLPMLSDVWDFQIFTDHQWNRAMQYLDDDDSKDLYAGKEVRLDAMTRRALAEHRPRRLDELPLQLARNVDDDPSLRNKQFKALAYLPIRQAQDANLLAARIEELFDSNPGVDKIELIRTGDTLRMMGNIVGVPHQSIVEVDPDIDWDQPVYLTYAGQYRARDMGTRDRKGEIDTLIHGTGTATGDNVEGVVANPTIQLYRISTRHWTASN
ncbi:MAG TPA: hypothetical protein VFL59_16205, partial [Candidatus Nanopelagicales bacterium]|nr:hypothetical protein [Candidatus Nanopelagicales bacterium]